jgi:hypothetical protein
MASSLRAFEQPKINSPTANTATISLRIVPPAFRALRTDVRGPGRFNCSESSRKGTTATAYN